MEYNEIPDVIIYEDEGGNVTNTELDAIEQQQAIERAKKETTKRVTSQEEKLGMDSWCMD